MAINGTNPWQNNIGLDWNHNYNLRIYTSEGQDANGNPTKAVFYDEMGDADYFENPSIEGGITKYSVSSPEQSMKRAVKLLRDDTTGRFTMKTPDKRTYGFSAPTTDTYRVCRLEWIKDRSGNITALEYDGANGVGKLTKVVPPSGDDRYLELAYSGNYVVTAKLMKQGSGTALSQSFYAYNGSELTKTTRVDGSTVKYTPATVVGATNSHYLSEYRDPRDNATSFSVNYVYDNTLLAYRATKVAMTTPNGTNTGYERDFAAGLDSTMNTVTKSAGGATFEKTRYGANGGYYVGQMKYWEDPASASATKDTDYTYTDNLSGGKDVTAITAPSDCSKALSYTSDGMLATQSDGTDDVTISYAGDGVSIASILDAAGLTTSYYYDLQDRVTRITDPAYASAGVSHEYDTATGRLTKTRDPLGNISNYFYDACRGVTAVDSNNITKRFYNDDRGNVTKEIDGYGNCTDYYYTETCGGCGGGGMLTRVSNAAGNTDFVYDAAGNPSMVTDPTGVVAELTYDSSNHIVTAEYPADSGNMLRYEYDSLDRMTRSYDFNNRITNFKYDYKGRLITKSIGSGAAEDIIYTAEYADTENTFLETNGGGNYLLHVYDGYSARLICEYGPEFGARYRYDDAGRLTKKESGAWGDYYDPIYYYYDPTTGQLTQTEYYNNGIGDSVYYEYDGLSRNTKITDWMEGNGYRYDFDSGGRLTRIRDYNDQTLSYTYDAANNVVTMVDWHGAETTYGYDAVNRLTRMTAPGPKTWWFYPNAVNQPILVCNPNSTNKIYEYDGRHRLTRISEGSRDEGFHELTYCLDNVGNVMGVEQSNGADWSYGYDHRYRLTSAVRNDGVTSGSISATYTYQYDRADNLLTKVEPFNDDFNDRDYTGWSTSGSLTAADHCVSKTATGSTAGLSKSHSDNNLDLWFDYKKEDTDTSSCLIIRLRGNSTNYTAMYIYKGRIRLYTVVNGTGSFYDPPVATSTTENTWYEVYARCDGQNITIKRRVKDQGSFEEVLAVSNDPTTSNTSLYFYWSAPALFSVDNIRLLSNNLSTTTAYEYNEGCELTKMTKGSMATIFDYDHWGRQNTKYESGGSHSASYTYRYDSKMCTATTDFPDESNLTLAYDGLGKLRQSWGAGGTSNKYRWDRGWNLINIEGSDGTLQHTVWYQALQDAMAPLAVSTGANPSAGAWNFFVNDIINSVRETRDSGGTKSGSYEFTPYGDDYFRDGLLPAGFGFTGKRRFNELGQYHFPYRMYSPQLGRWLMHDPAGTVSGLNAFAYTHDCPILFFDKFGLQELDYQYEDVFVLQPQGHWHRLSNIAFGFNEPTRYCWRTTSTGNDGPGDCQDCCHEMAEIHGGRQQQEIDGNCASMCTTNVARSGREGVAYWHAAEAAAQAGTGCFRNGDQLGAAMDSDSAMILIVLLALGLFSRRKVEERHVKKPKN